MTRKKKLSRPYTTEDINMFRLIVILILASQFVFTLLWVKDMASLITPAS